MYGLTNSQQSARNHLESYKHFQQIPKLHAHTYILYFLFELYCKLVTYFLTHLSD